MACYVDSKINIEIHTYQQTNHCVTGSEKPVHPLFCSKYNNKTLHVLCMCAFFRCTLKK